MISFVFDTSAFISLEIVYLLDTIFKNFRILSSPRVLDEINDFALHDDELGKIAQRILEKKNKIIFQKAELEEELSFVSHTDNELFNLSFFENITLITDDIKLTRHAEAKIQTVFSVSFLFVFIESGLLTKHEKGLKSLNR